jgi:hypothetical protein
MTKVVFKTENKFSLHAEDCQIHMDEFTDESNFELKPLENETGAGCDYFTDLPLIREIIDRFPLEEDEKINWMDLGCAGGHLILDVNDQKETDICIGVDGSVGVYKQESWSSGKNKEVLNNADLSKDFSVEHPDGGVVPFDVITCWEVIEHFNEPELDTFFTTVDKHLADTGVFCGSIALCPDIKDEKGYHPEHPKFNPDGKVYQLHKLIWPTQKWMDYLGQYFNVINYDFNAHFRDDGSGYVKTYSYFFACTKKS